MSATFSSLPTAIQIPASRHSISRRCQARRQRPRVSASRDPEHHRGRKDQQRRILHQPEAGEGHYRRLRRLIGKRRKQEHTMAEKPRLKLPAEAKKGDVIEIKTLLPHVMEFGPAQGQGRQRDPAQNHQQVRLRIQRQAGVLGESRSGNRRQSVHAVQRKGRRERDIQIHLDR